MRWLNWGKRHKVSVLITPHKEVHGLKETIAACDDDSTFIYNKYCRVFSLERPVDRLNERQLADVQAYKARLEGDADLLTDASLAM